MNNGTRIRTALRVAVSLNTAVYTVTAAVGQLGWGWLTIAWAVLTIISDFAVAFITTYYNNDYTVEGEVGTKVTREMKARRGDTIEPAEEPEDSEVADDLEVDVEVESGVVEDEE